MGDASMLVTFEALANAAQQIQTTYNNLNSKLDDLKQQLQPMVSTWTGAASEQYQVQQAAWNSAQTDLNTVLQAIGQAVNAAHDAYTQTEQANTRAWS